MNVHDSDWLRAALCAHGWTEGSEEDARVFILNTCSVREKPEQKVYSLLGRLAEHARRRSGVFAAVGGCVAQQVGRKFLERFPFVRLVFGTDQTGQVPDTLSRLIERPGEKACLLDFERAYPEREMVWPGGSGLVSREPGSAFVTIMQGCDNFCAYCIVPYTRGRQKSRSSQAVLEECRELLRLGVREITLLGQNVNSYGKDKYGDGTSFAKLLEQTASLPGLARLRFTTSHPKDLSQDVVEAFARFENICPHLHLPLQSGSDTVLERMGRGYDMARYLGIVRALKAARPDMALTTDLIVGFPGETDDDFKKTLDAVETVGFEGGFSFMYSDRPKTRSLRMAPKIDLEVKRERLACLQKLLDARAECALSACVGRKTEVMAAGRSKRPEHENRASWRGRDVHGRVVNFTCPEKIGAEADLAGKLVKVRILSPKKHSLWGEATGEPW